MGALETEILELLKTLEVRLTRLENHVGELTEQVGKNTGALDILKRLLTALLAMAIGSVLFMVLR